MIIESSLSKVAMVGMVHLRGVVFCHFVFILAHTGIILPSDATLVRESWACVSVTLILGLQIDEIQLVCFDTLSDVPSCSCL
jgi:hypothetical protein